MRKVKNVVNELNHLSVTEITELLKDEAVKGKRYQKCDCPIANYVKRETGVGYVEVTSRGVYTYHTGTLPLASGPRSFLPRFDEGSIPALEA